MQHATTNTLNVEPTKDDDGFATLPHWISIQYLNNFEIYLSWRLKWATAETLRPNSRRDCIFWIIWPYVYHPDPPPLPHPLKYWGKSLGLQSWKSSKCLGKIPWVAVLTILYSPLVCGPEWPVEKAEKLSDPKEYHHRIWGSNPQPHD